MKNSILRKINKAIGATLTAIIITCSCSSYSRVGAWYTLVGQQTPVSGYQSSYSIRNYPNLLNEGGYYGRWYTNRDRNGEYYIPAMQKLLCIPSSQCDGALGSQTENKIIDFQSRHGLVDDGIIGVRTFEILMRESELTRSSTPINRIRHIEVTTNGSRFDTTFSYYIDNYTTGYDAVSYLLN